MAGAGSVDLLGQRLADRFAFEVVAPFDRRVRAVAIGLVGRLAAAACDHAVADFVGVPVLAPQEMCIRDRSMIESTKAGLTLNPNELEAHYLAGGNVTNVVHALVSAQKANIMLDFKMATAIDLARCV